MAAKIVDIFTGINYSRYQVNQGQGWLKKTSWEKSSKNLLHLCAKRVSYRV